MGEKILSNTNTYKCSSCGYSAGVWEAPDKAPIATVDTRHCLGCKALVEVPIEFNAGALIDDQDSNLHFLNRCPNCDSSNVQPWHIKHPCPKCGEHMTKYGNGSLAN